MRSLDEIMIPSVKPHTIAVAVAQDAPVLSAVESARRMGLANAILVGDIPAINRVSQELNISLEPYTLVQESDEVAACQTAVRLVREGKAHVLMKGLVETGVLMKVVLSGEYGLRTGQLLSHLAIFEVPGFDRIIGVTDAAMNIAPTEEEKKQIILNAASVFHALGYEDPIVACLCAVEKVKAKMPATIEAAALSQAGLPGCQVVGPLALDNALFPEAAVHKGITDPRAGYADILLLPDIEAGNVMYKALTFLAKARNAAIIVGAKCPIVLTSRSDAEEAKLNSIAFALYVAANSSKEFNT